MDHARHLSSPSPTSSFLFQHSERSMKSSLLGPSLLSSANDVNGVDDCFSMASSTIATNHHQSTLQNGLTTSYNGDNHDDGNQILVSDDNDHHHQNHRQLENHVNHSLDNDERHRTNHLVSDQDSLNDVDDDDGMHNMLSGSSTSSTTTMPLLSDAHSDHPFSRISLEEYSPLSLVDDCDNALNISSASLACGSHHSFKSSLNNLKLDNLDGVDVSVHNHVDDVVGDTRSMSPSMMSGTTSTIPNHLWSNSSTAITQNPALLTSSSASFLLSHHHHHYQLNSLMQQLEPPTSINHGSIYESDQLDHQHHHRPSSEPPPGCGSELCVEEGPKPNDAAESVNSKQTALTSQAKAKAQLQTGSKSKSSATNNAPSSSSSSSRSSSSRKSRSKAANAPTSTKANSNVAAKSHSEDEAKKAESKAGPAQTESAYCSSKVHLQLNHHKKLWELQQRLFGSTVATNSSSTDAQSAVDSQAPVTVKAENHTDHSDNSQSRARATSVSTSSTPSNNQSGTLVTSPTDLKAEALPLETEQASTQTQAAPESAPTKSRPRFRQTPRRRFKASKNEQLASTGSPPTSSSISPLSAQKIVATESVEPDTTTKTSDCIKLADLLSNTKSIETHSADRASNTSGNSLGSQSSRGDASEQNDSAKQIQHIQLQVNPSLKLLTNGSLVQSLGVQQQMSNNNISIVGSGRGPLDNQVLCRPVTVMTSLNGNANGAMAEPLKFSILPNGDWLKCAETLPNWSVSNQNNGNGTSGNIVSTNTSNNQTMGAHQFAIQVICQDGTSLVLPVSSAAGLNTAISVATQNRQQLQAALNSGSKCANQQHAQKISAQSTPLVSVANILAQQQTASAATNFDSGIGAQTIITQTSQSGNGNPTTAQASGLAASSPTLAALLDAGSNRMSNNTDQSANHSVVSSNLLRKLVGVNQPGGSVDFRRGEINLQPGTQIGLTNNGSLVTICTTNAGSSAMINPNIRLSTAGHCIGDKRIKLDNVAEVDGNIQTTFTLIEPQGLIVANGNEAKLLQNEQIKQADLTQTKAAEGLQAMSNGSSFTALQQQSNGTSSKVSSDISPGTNKQNKMTSSTGNRQVDPTQPFRCEHCNSTFTRLGNFTRHKKIHSAPTKDGQRFKCDVCSKSFLQRCDLARHLHIHRGTEPHRCNICGKGYIRHSDLVTHQRFHNKEKPFGCPHCSKGFCQRGDLNRHLRSIHLQMKPILCPCCNRKFAKQETLLRHLNTSHRS